MTETQNVATYARIRPYNPAINEDKKLSCRAMDNDKILCQNGDTEDTYNFTKVFDMKDSTETLFEEAMQPLLDHKILQGITSIFIVYGQSGSGKSFTLIGEKEHLGVLAMSLQYLLKQDIVESIDTSCIEAYGINQAKIGFFDLVAQLKAREESSSQKKKKYDAYSCKDNPRLHPSNAESLAVTKENCFEVIFKLQNVSHMAPTLKNPHSSRGHTVYFNRIKMRDLEDVYLICIDLAGSEGQTALGSKQEFVDGLKLAMSKGKLRLSSKQMAGVEQMYKTRSLEAGCINNGLTQLQSIFAELVKKKISKSQGLGLRKMLSQYVTLKAAYAILFTLSASASNTKITRATLKFAKQTQLVQVDTHKAKKKIDKDRIIRELEEVIKELKQEMKEKDLKIIELQKRFTQTTPADMAAAVDMDDDDEDGTGGHGDGEQKQEEEDDLDEAEVAANSARRANQSDVYRYSRAFERFDELSKQIEEAHAEEAKWTATEEMMVSQCDTSSISEEEMKKIFDELDEDGSGKIDARELHKALLKMGKKLSMQEANELIQQLDEDGDGQIDFEEFRVMMKMGWFVDAFHGRLMTAMMAALQVENERLHDEIKQIETDSDNVSGTVNEHTDHILTLRSEIDQLTSKLTVLQVENEALRDQQHSLSDQLQSELQVWREETMHQQDEEEEETSSKSKNGDSTPQPQQPVVPRKQVRAFEEVALSPCLIQ
eukprot:CAMPEP_0197027474 /NCGR_PEP_ID=MMETSP1384-20130603/7367_1 /TAXON_ID=29189 /ORGANISM="Ammonia sp." /LENGTH=713 /DNA_ID=CAMNT_0042456321 /DNA_START=31 /DNA_END=2172 /DNA_ORIENTATION=-